MDTAPLTKPNWPKQGNCLRHVPSLSIYKYCSKQSNNKNWKWAFVLTPSLQKQMQYTKFTMWEIPNKVLRGNVLLQKQIIVHQMCACLDLDAKKLKFVILLLILKTNSEIWSGTRYEVTVKSSCHFSQCGQHKCWSHCSSLDNYYYH